MSQIWQVHTKSNFAQHVYTTKWEDTDQNPAATHELPQLEQLGSFSHIEVVTESEIALSALNMNSEKKTNLRAESLFC